MGGLVQFDDDCLGGERNECNAECGATGARWTNGVLAIAIMPDATPPRRRTTSTAGPILPLCCRGGRKARCSATWPAQV